MLRCCSCANIIVLFICSDRDILLLYPHNVHFYFHISSYAGRSKDQTMGSESYIHGLRCCPSLHRPPRKHQQEQIHARHTLICNCHPRDTSRRRHAPRARMRKTGCKSICDGVQLDGKLHKAREARGVDSCTQVVESVRFVQWQGMPTRDRECLQALQWR